MGQVLPEELNSLPGQVGKGGRETKGYRLPSFCQKSERKEVRKMGEQGTERKVVYRWDEFEQMLEFAEVIDGGEALSDVIVEPHSSVTLVIVQ